MLRGHADAVPRVQAGKQYLGIGKISTYNPFLCLVCHSEYDKDAAGAQV